MIMLRNIFASLFKAKQPPLYDWEGKPFTGALTKDQSEKVRELAQERDYKSGDFVITVFQNAKRSDRGRAHGSTLNIILTSRDVTLATGRRLRFPPLP